MGGSFGSWFSLLYPLGMLVVAAALIALVVVAIMVLLTWRRRLDVAIELDRLRIQQHVARGGSAPPID